MESIHGDILGFIGSKCDFETLKSLSATTHAIRAVCWNMMKRLYFFTSECDIYDVYNLKIKTAVTLTPFTNLRTVMICKTVDDAIPSTVTHVIIDDYAAGSCCLPDSVTHLTLRRHIDHSISLVGSTPNLNFGLNFGWYFTKPMNITPSITHLNYCWVFDEPLKTYIPPSVNEIYFGTQYDIPRHECLPPNVNVTFTWDFGGSINDHIPHTVYSLIFYNGFNQPINECLPNTVTNVCFYDDFDQSIVGSIPDSVIELVLAGKFNQPINACIPDSVKKLYLGSSFNQPIDDALLARLTTLKIGNVFKK